MMEGGKYGKDDGPEDQVPLELEDDEVVDENETTGDMDMEVNSCPTTTSREYQLSLFETAKRRNLIVCLPTGSGKTWIALLLTKYYLPDCIKNKKKVVFLANTVALVEQQYEYFRSNIDVSANENSSHVSHFVGKMDVDNWDAKKWNHELQKPEVLIFSTQVFLNILNRHIKMEDILLLVFDECHHATKEHTMVSVMKNYKEINKGRSRENQTPRILGLTATIIKGLPKKPVDKEIEQMEDMLCSRAITYHKYEEVLMHSTKADIRCVVYNETTPIASTSAIAALKKAAKRLGLLIQKIDKHKQKVFLQNRKSGRSILYAKKESIIRTLKNYFETLFSIHDTMAYIVLVQVESKISMASSAGFNFLLSLYISTLGSYLFNVSSMLAQSHTDAFMGKLINLLKVLRDEGKNFGESNFCCIVFVQRILDCQVLHWVFQDFIRDHPKTYGFLKTNFITSVRGEGVGDEWIPSSMTEKIRRETIQGFRKGRYNLLFSTAVLEEGLDVPSCNLIVRFDRVQEFRSFTQSMGRARHKDAKFVVFCPESDEKKVRMSLASFRGFDYQLAEALKKRALHVDDEDIICEEAVEELAPFRPGGSPDSPCILPNDAISIVNWYCQSLFGGSYGSSGVPVSWYTQTDEGFCAELILPNQAAIKGVIQGPVLSNKVVAKKGAFLEACKKLYNAGCLNELLRPFRKTMDPKIIEFFDLMEPAHCSELPKGWAAKGVPKHITQCVEPHEDTFVYEFDMQLLLPEGLEKEAIYDYSGRTWATTLWSRSSLDMIPPFRLVSSMGDLKFGLKNITGTFKGTMLTPACITRFKKFQKTLFFDILKLSLHCAEEMMDSGIYIVPMKKKTINGVQEYLLDFDSLDKLTEVYTHSEMSNFAKQVAEDERGAPENDPAFMEMGGYREAVVVPWHNENTPVQMYCVVGVERDESPLSAFDDTTKATTYSEYFKKNYSINIVDNEQPLIKCYKLQSNLNYLMLRKNEKFNTSKKAKTSRSVITLVPELVRWFPIPATLYTQAKIIPTILHRITGFLHAMEVGASISNVDLAELSSPSYNANDKWSYNEVLGDRNDSGEDVTILELGASGEATTEKDSQGPRKQKIRLVEKQESESHVGIVIDSTYSLIAQCHPMDITEDHINELKVQQRRKTKEKSSNAAKKRNGNGYTSNVCGRSGIVESSTSTWIRLLPAFDKLDLKPLKIPADAQIDFIRSPPVYEILQAITLAGGQDRISLERLEIIGDSFLKFAATMFLYGHFPESDEGELTTLRSKLVSNKNLKLHGDKRGLKEIISASFFFPHYAFLPPTYSVNEKCTMAAMKAEVPLQVFHRFTKDELESKTMEEMYEFAKTAPPSSASKRTILGFSKLREKDVADCVEALIGAYYVTGGENAALHVMDWLGIRGPDKNGKGTSIADWKFEPQSQCGPRNESVRSPEYFVPCIRDLESLICYEFKDKWLVVEAFTHMNNTSNHVTPSFQRLEFLGDAVLDFLITNYIYKNSDAKSPGEVTDLRSALVNNVTFGSLAVRYGLHTMLLQSSKDVHAKIHKFAALQEECEHRVTGQFTLLHEEEAVRAVDVEVPKVLGDIFESLCGAVYIDTGRDLDFTWKVFYRLMKLEIDEFSASCPKSPIREIMERGYKFALIKNEGKGTKPKVRVRIEAGQFGVFEGYGTSMKSAKEAAAKYAQRAIHAKN